MRIGRTLPPVAAPLAWSDLCHGLWGIASSKRARRRLEEEVQQYFNVAYVFPVSSGTAALTVTLMALKADASKTEVILPAYTCFSVPAAILKAGLRPVLCDIDPATFDFGPSLEQTMNERTLCVVVHRLFGIASDIGRLRALCQARGVFVVEDAAQAMGVQSNGRMLGTYGDVGIFSLGRGKNITCGSGGLIVTNSARLADAIRREWRTLASPSPLEVLKEFVRVVLMTIFMRPRLYWIPAALPFLRLGQTIFPKDVPLKRLSGMQAGLLRNWRTRLNQANRARSETATYFRMRLSLDRPSLPYLRLPMFAASPTDRQRIQELAERRGLGLSAAYPTPINEIPEISRMFDGGPFPSARYVAEHILTIPTHQWVSEHDKRAIAECVELARAS